MSGYSKNSFPITVKIDWEEFIHYSGLSIRRTIKDFVDTFSVSLNNPFGRYSTEIPVGCVVEILYQGVLIFIGIGEEKETSYSNVGSQLTISGREEIIELTETDADPTKWPFKEMTDNEIIELILEWTEREQELWEGVKIKEYAIKWGSARKAQVIEEICMRNDFVFYKKGNTVYKTKIPNWPEKPSSKFFTLSVVNEELQFENNRVIGFNIKENVTSTRFRIKGYWYEKGKKKVKVEIEHENSTMQTGLYARRIRNQSNLTGRALERNGFVTTTGKDKSEVEAQVKKALRDTDLKAELVITVADFVDVDLFDNVDVMIEIEKINQTMYVTDIQYKLENTNKRTTQITLVPFNDL